ncbi:MAG TPA: phosphoribosyltransferase family protein [Candidatus Limnocylindrales bacterium]|nr:phosphoribosyltransferase family protein [Candidatus Limnocylindrales bacterium]
MNGLAVLRRYLRLPAGRCPSCGAFFGSPLCRECISASGIDDRPFRTRVAFHELQFVGAYWSRQPGAAVSLSPLGRALRGFKDRGDRYAGRCLGALFAMRLAGTIDPAEVIVPIPSDVRRLRARGLSPAAWLADALSRSSRARLSQQSLVRTRDRPAQRTLGGAARRANAEGAFGLGPDGVRGYSVVLVDDVITTGATLRAAATALWIGGADRVRCAVLACADEEILNRCRARTESAGRGAISVRAS